MTTDLSLADDQALAEHLRRTLRAVAETVDAEPVDAELSTAQPGNVFGNPDTQRPRAAEPPRWPLLGAVAALIAIMVGGIAVLANRSGSSTPADQPTPVETPLAQVETPLPSVVVSLPVSVVTEPHLEPLAPSLRPIDAVVMLADVDDVPGGSWVYPTWLPDGVEYQFATFSPAAVENLESFPWARSVYLDDDIVIEVRTAGSSMEGIPQSVAGHDWLVEISEDWWSATRQLDSVSVTAWGSGSFDNIGRRVVEGLAVIAEEQLPSRPLSYFRPGTEVATFDLDGELVTLEVEESNGYFCSKVGGADGGAGSCATTFVDSDVAVQVAGGRNGKVGASTVQLTSGGFASLDVARVDVEFVDGVVVSVEPMDLSGQFDIRFWVAATTMEVADIQDPLADTFFVIDVRAYDADSKLLLSRPLGL